MSYYKNMQIKRFAIYCSGELRSETSDYDQMRHVLSLYETDGERAVECIVFNANQVTPKTLATTPNRRK